MNFKCDSKCKNSQKGFFLFLKKYLALIYSKHIKYYIMYTIKFQIIMIFFNNNMLLLFISNSWMYIPVVSDAGIADVNDCCR